MSTTSSSSPAPLQSDVESLRRIRILSSKLYFDVPPSKVAGHMFDPELVVYNAGTDVLDGDPLGRLKISPEGVTSRDEKVFGFARERNIPLVMLTSGGYMKSSARVIADSIVNLSKKCLIDMGGSSG